MQHDTTTPRSPRTHGGAAARWSPERVAEVMDALWHARREVPPWVLAEVDGGLGAPAVAPGGSTPGERALLGERLSHLTGSASPRTVVLIGGATADAASPLLDALLGRAPVPLVVALDLAEGRARAAAERLSARHPDLPVAPVVANPTLDLALPRHAPHPRLCVAMANGLGAFGTVGAVRLLRVVRATMGADDRLLLGLDLRRDRAVLEGDGYDAAGANAARHLAVLPVLNRQLGTDFDAAGFVYRVVYDDESRRVDTLLVASRGMRVACARRDAFRLRKGEPIRTAVDCKYDRGRVTAMLGGVGLRLVEWHEDAAGSAALAVVGPAT